MLSYYQAFLKTCFPDKHILTCLLLMGPPPTLFCLKPTILAQEGEVLLLCLLTRRLKKLLIGWMGFVYSTLFSSYWSRNLNSAHRGFQLRVTWANIDRSNGYTSKTVSLASLLTYLSGFMSGYDRTNLAQDEIPLTRSLPSVSSTCSKNAAGSMDVNTIVASNIPISLFPKNEIEILFKPFGEIRRIQIIHPHAPSGHPLVTLSPASSLAQTVIVTFENANDAIAAKNTLHGQVYEGFTLAVGFVANSRKEESLLSKVPALKPLALSTNCTAHYAFNQLSSLSNMPIEQIPQGLSLPSHEAVPFQYATTLQPIFSRQENWTPYSASLPDASFNYQLQPTVLQTPGENTCVSVTTSFLSFYHLII